MKRILCLLLVLLLIPAMVVPASATTADAIEDQTFWLLGDLDWFSDSLGGLGEIYYAILDVLDRLDWLDSTMRDVESAIIDGLKTGVTETIGQLVAIIKDTVLSIKDTVVNIHTALQTGSPYPDTNTIGKVIYKIYSYLSSTLQSFIRSIDSGITSIKDQLTAISNGRQDISSSVRDEADDKDDEIDNINDTLATAPTIDQDEFDSVISDVDDKFSNITTDNDGGILFGSLAQISETDVFREIVPVSAMLGVISFVLFGKVF